MQPPPTPSVRRRIAGRIENLFPGYFALVMATGIVSVAADVAGMPPVAWALLAINIAAYAVLGLMLVVRLTMYFGRVLDDLWDHARAAPVFSPLPPRRVCSGASS
jgi:tellurite resistance protein TehA-like permease